MKILFLTNLLPLPLDNGGKIKTYTTLCGLHQGGHQIDLLCFTEEKKVDKDIIYELGKICSSINTIYLKLTSSTNKVYMFMILLKSLLSKYPLVFINIFLKR